MFDLKGYGPSLLEGTWLTIEVALLSLCIAMALGMVGAMAKLSQSRAARGLAAAYTTLIRGVPELVLMLLLFFGGQVMLNYIALEVLEFEDYIDINPFTAGVITIGFIYGAYMTETFRGAILSVPAGQLEAGHAYGMTKWQVFVRILLPQMIRFALPAFGNNWMVLLKATALVSVIGLDDVVRKAALAAGATRMPFTFYLTVGAIYLVMTSISIVVLNWAERRYSAGVRKA